MDDLFDFPKLRIKQPAQVLANRANYEIHGAGRRLAIVRETEPHGRLALMSQRMPGTRTLEVTTPAGEPVLTLVNQASAWVTEFRGPVGELIGRIRTGDTRRTYTLFDGQGHAVGEVTGDLALKRFIVTGPSGARLARVRKTWAGPLKELLTPFDHYKVEFTGLVPQPARTMTVMMPVLLDLTLYGPI